MWVVICMSGANNRCYGPFDNPDLAERFARYLSDEVDPAGVFPVHSPTAELLTWRDQVHRKGLSAVDRMRADAKRSPVVALPKRRDEPKGDAS